MSKCITCLHKTVCKYKEDHIFIQTKYPKKILVCEHWIYEKDLYNNTNDSNTKTKEFKL